MQRRRARAAAAAAAAARLRLFACVALAVIGVVCVLVALKASPGSAPPAAASALRRHAHAADSVVWLPSPRKHTTQNRTVSALNLERHQRIAHDTYYLGRHAHPVHGYAMDGYAFLHMHAKAAPAPGRRITKEMHFNRTEAALTTPTQCTAPISPGTYWKRSRGYYVHAANRHGLSAETVRNAYAAASDRWQCALDEVSALPAGPFLGFLDGGMQTAVPTGINEFAFGRIVGRAGVVGVTVSFGVFSGPKRMRHLSEYKLLLDEHSYAWGDGRRKRNVMDLQAVLTHELGHSLGLDDIYTGACAHVTMFGSSGEGMTDKRTLEPDDIDGLRCLYAGRT